MTTTSIADALTEALPGAQVLGADRARIYAVAGRLPQALVRPVDAAQVADLLRLAAERGWAVVPRGGGTLLDLGNPPERLDIVLDMTALDRVVDYQPDDMTVTAQAGVTLARLDALLSERGQTLPLDAPLPEQATVGGALAANVSGPRRLRFGTARDVVIGIEVATPGDGLARSGGRVVKNVAGYDMAKLHIGGLGTVGVITEATFKLQPTPPARAAVVASFAALDSARAAASAILRSQLFPAAMELLNSAAVERLAAGTGADGWMLAVLATGVPAAVERATREIAAYCTEAGAARHESVPAAQSDELFDALRDLGRSNEASAALILRAAALPSETATAMQLLAEAAVTSSSLVPSVVGRPAAGVAIGVWQSVEAATVASMVTALRRSLAEIGATLVVERAPLDSLGGLDVWGIDGPDIALMRRLKQTYDPAAVLNPGRFVAGL